MDGVTLGHSGAGPDPLPAMRPRRLVLRELRDPARVALVAGERFGDEGVDEGDRLVDRVLAGTDRDHVGVVVLARELRRGLRFQTSAARLPATLFAAICSPLPEPPNTTPSASTPGILVVHDRLRGVDAERRVVVERVVGRRSVVDDVVTGVGEVLLQELG